jgi:4-hydroxy-tetrahydrodipicolinate synthase
VLGAILTAMATPFDADLRVDEAAAARLANHLVEHGSDGLVMAGTTGEASTLTDDEKVTLYRIAKREVGDRASVVAGTGSNDTAHSVHLTRLAAEEGADAVLVVTPYYNRPPRAGIVGHVEAIAAVGVPVVLYNIPSRSAVNMPPDLIAELGQIDNVVAVKQANDEELGPIDGLTILAGNDNTFLRVLEFGGGGAICVASHLVGDRMREMWDAARSGDLERARRIDAEITPIYEATSVTTNPIPLKAALAMLGLCEDRLRLPLVPADDEQRAAIKAGLDAAGVAVAS